MSVDPIRNSVGIVSRISMDADLILIGFHCGFAGSKEVVDDDDDAGAAAEDETLGGVTAELAKESWEVHPSIFSIRLHFQFSFFYNYSYLYLHHFFFFFFFFFFIFHRKHTNFNNDPSWIFDLIGFFLHLLLIC